MYLLVQIEYLGAFLSGCFKGILESGLALLVAPDRHVHLLQSSRKLAGECVLAPTGHPATGASPVLEEGRFIVLVTIVVTITDDFTG